MANLTCVNCSKGAPLPGDPKGIVDPSTTAYLAEGPTDNPSRPAVVLLTDGFGLPFKNCKLLADMFSERLGCDVWIPDIFDGNPMLGINELVEYMPDRANAKISWAGMFWILISMLGKIPKAILHRPAVMDARIDLFLETLRDKHKYVKIGAIGYCIGGAAAVRLGSRGLVDSVVICHPGPITNGQVRAIAVPTSWVCAEDDMFFSNSARLNAEAAFASQEGKRGFVDYEFKVYEGTAHGFAARPNLSVPAVKEAYEQALNQATNWFKKTLSV